MVLYGSYVVDCDRKYYFEQCNGLYDVNINLFFGGDDNWGWGLGLGTGDWGSFQVFSPRS